MQEYLLENLMCKDPFPRQSWTILKMADLGKLEVGTFVSLSDIWGKFELSEK